MPINYKAIKRMTDKVFDDIDNGQTIVSPSADSEMGVKPIGHKIDGVGYWGLIKDKLAPVSNVKLKDLSGADSRKVLRLTTQKLIEEANLVITDIDNDTTLDGTDLEDVLTNILALTLSGFVSVPTAQDANSAVFDATGLPVLADMENRIISFYASDDHLEGSSYTVTWGTSAVLLNHDGNALESRQITSGSLVTMMYNGTNWVLVGTVDPVNGGVFIGDIGFGSAPVGEWLNHDPKITQTRNGGHSSIQSSKKDYSRLYDTWASGMRTELLIGESAEVSFVNPTGEVDSGFIAITSNGYVVSAGPTTTVTKSPSDILTTGSVGGYTLRSLGASIGGNIYATSAQTTPPIYQIRKSIDKGVSFEVQYIPISGRVGGGIATFPGGQLVITDMSYGVSSLGDTSPTPRYIVNEYSAWSLGVSISDCMVVDLPATSTSSPYVYFMKSSNGDLFFIANRLTESGYNYDYATVWKAPSITGAWSVVGPVLSGTTGNKEHVTSTFINTNDDSLFCGIIDYENDTVVIRKGTSGGTSFATVYSIPYDSANYVIKFVDDGLGTIIAMIHQSTGTLFIYSTDGGSTWDEMFSNAYNYTDISYSEYDRAIYACRSDAGGAVTDVIKLEKHFATLDNSRPIKIRMTGSNVDVSISRDVVNEDDEIEFESLLSITDKGVKLLPSSTLAITENEAPLGTIFRNSNDSNYLSTKELDGTNRRVSGLWTRESNGDSVLYSASGAELERIDVNGNIAYNGAIIPGDVSPSFKHTFHGNNVITIIDPNGKRLDAVNGYISGTGWKYYTGGYAASLTVTGLGITIDSVAVAGTGLISWSETKRTDVNGNIAYNGASMPDIGITSATISQGFEYVFRLKNNTASNKTTGTIVNAIGCYLNGASVYTAQTTDDLVILALTNTGTYTRYVKASPNIIGDSYALGAFTATTIA